MDAPRELKLTLPPDLAQAVREEMVAGGYADEMQVIRESLSALTGRDLAVETWLAGPVRETYAKWAEGTLATVSMKEVRAKFEAESVKRR